MKYKLRRLGLFSFLLSLALVINVEAIHRPWGKSGTATTTNATLTAPNNLSSICVTNTGTTNNLFIDYSDGVATTADDSTNHLISPGATLCLGWDDKNVTNDFTIGVITSASTTTYNINGTQR
jgi:hypothetical protein